MPTTDELYDQLGLATQRNERLAAAAHRRIAAERREEARAGQPPPPPPLHPDCAAHGHYSKGSWCEWTTGSGKRLGKCGRCEQGFELPPPQP